MHSTFCSTVLQSQLHITNHTNVALFVLVAAAAAAAAAADLVMRGSVPTGSLHNHSNAQSLLCSMQGLRRMLKGSVLECALCQRALPTLRGHQSGLEGMWVKKLGLALRPKLVIPPKGLWAAALLGPQPAPLTPLGMSLSATV